VWFDAVMAAETTWRTTLAAVALPIVLVSASPSLAHSDDSAWVARINGAPTLTRAQKTTALHRGDTVGVGDLIETDDKSKVKILLADDSILDIGPGTRVSLEQFLVQPHSRTVQLKVLVGKFKLAIAKFFGGPSDYEVHTPTAVAGVRGTTLWGDTQRDVICALDGTIEVRALAATENAAHVAAGQCVNQMSAGKTAPLVPSAEELAVYLREVTLD
jgi:hypothetical protein